MASTTGDLTTTGSVTLTKAARDSQVLVQISGTYGTVTAVIEGSIDGTLFFPLDAKARETGAIVTGTISPSDNTTRVFVVEAAGMTKVRWRNTAQASGTISLALNSASYYAAPPVQLYQSGMTFGATTVASLTSSGAITGTTVTPSTGVREPVTTVAAAGTVIGNAAALSEGFNLVTAADNTKGVILPAFVAGEKIKVKNNTSGKILLVYPPVGGKINGGAANAVYNVAALAERTFHVYNSTDSFTDPETIA